MALQQLSTNTFTVAKWVVSADATQGTHTTIQAAITAASSGDTIWIRDGTYTENLTLKVGVDLAAATADAYEPNVVIKGKCTLTTAGTVSMSGIELMTNSDFCIAVTGSAASIIILNACLVNCADNTGISFTSSSSSSSIQINNSNLTITTGALFASSSAGTLFFDNCFYVQGSSTDSTISAGMVQFVACYGSLTITTSGTADFYSQGSHFQAGGTAGAIVLTHGGSGANSYVAFSSFQNNSNTNPAVSISVGATLKTTQSSFINFNGSVASVSGAGTLVYSLIDSNITTNTLNVSNYTKVPIDTGPVRAPSITFDGTNVLSSYTTGTWTPSLNFGGSTTGITYSEQDGTYQKIGKFVFVVGVIALSNKGAQVGTAQISGLPFTSATTSGAQTPGRNAVEFTALTLTASYTTAFLNFLSNSTSAQCEQAGSGQNAAVLTNTNFANNTVIYISGLYLAAS